MTQQQINYKIKFLCSRDGDSDFGRHEMNTYGNIFYITKHVNIFLLFYSNIVFVVCFKFILPFMNHRYYIVVIIEEEKRREIVIFTNHVSANL